MGCDHTTTDVGWVRNDPDGGVRRHCFDQQLTLFAPSLHSLKLVSTLYQFPICYRVGHDFQQSLTLCLATC
jgi:hypothetical protein